MTQTLMMAVKLGHPSPQPGPVCHVTYLITSDLLLSQVNHAPAPVIC